MQVKHAAFCRLGGAAKWVDAARHGGHGSRAVRGLAWAPSRGTGGNGEARGACARYPGGFTFAIYCTVNFGPNAASTHRTHMNCSSRAHAAQSSFGRRPYLIAQHALVLSHRSCVAGQVEAGTTYRAAMHRRAKHAPQTPPPNSLTYRASTVYRNVISTSPGFQSARLREAAAVERAEEDR
jgi:hypothetical protein